MDESSKFNTFFDIGIEEETKPFAHLRSYIYGNKKKKRVVNNELIKKYLLKESLTKEELIRVKKILDGSIYSERQNHYEHCKLCSSEFERYDLLQYSSKFQYWNICIPTFPYFPGGLMIYLKDREHLRIENIQDLPQEMIEELIYLLRIIYIDLRERVFNNQLVGINILFNQLSKSELCIHGHVEPIIHDIDQYNYGCEYIPERVYDNFTSIINHPFINHDIVLCIPEGIKIPIYNYSNIKHIQELLKVYEERIYYFFERGKSLKKGETKIETPSDQILFTNMVPAATNFVYLTYYKDKVLLSSVPELTLDFVNLKDISEDSADLYCLSINREYTNENNVFMRHLTPTIRPSIKIFTQDNIVNDTVTLQRKIKKELER